MLSIEYLRQFRLGDYALFDLTLALAGIYLLSPLLSKLFLKLNIVVSRKSWLFLAIPLGILIHILVGSYTPMTLQFLDLRSHYLLKIFVLAMLFLGLKDIKLNSKK